MADGGREGQRRRLVGQDEKYNIDDSLRILQSEHFKECI